MHTFSFIHVIYLALAILLDVVANIFLKFSDGFKNKIYGFFAILFVLAAFTFLSFAVKTIPLAVAYGIWGGLGLIATAVLGSLLFNERIRLAGIVGILLVIGGIILFKFT